MLLLLIQFSGVAIYAQYSPSDSIVLKQWEANKKYINVSLYDNLDYDSVQPLFLLYPTIENKILKAKSAFVLGHISYIIFDTPAALTYFQDCAEIYKSTGNWEQYANAIKDLNNAKRMLGQTDSIAYDLKKVLEISKIHNIGFQVLNPLQELVIHYAYTAGNYPEALKYGKQFQDSLKKFTQVHIIDPDYLYSTTVDAAIVDLEMGHSYLELGQLTEAEKYLNKAAQFFGPRNDHEKLNRIYLHLSKLALKKKEFNKIDTLQKQMHFHANMHQKIALKRFNKIPTFIRKINELNKTVEQRQGEIRALTRERYYITGLSLLLLGFTVLGLIYLRKSKQNQIQLNALLQNEFEMSEKLNSEKSRYFAILSHELRTPIFAVTGLAKLLRQRENNTPKNIEAIINSGNHLLQLVNNVLQHHKIEKSDEILLENEVFDIAQIYEEVSNTVLYLADQKNVTIEIDNQIMSKYPVKGDKQKLIQIIANLITNAIKNCTTNGTLKIVIYLVESDVEKSTFHFSFTDDGSGLNQEVIKQILSNETATLQDDLKQISFYLDFGIGLHIVTEFLNAMNSEIVITNEEKGGSKFCFDLSLLNASEQPCKNLLLPIDETKFNILIVDDIKLNLIVSEKTISNLGYNCFTATDKDPVIEIIKNQNIHLVLMDLNMPSIDGYQLSINIRNAGLQIPIIAHTALIKENIDLEKLEEVTIVDYIVKPYQIEDLETKLKQHLLQYVMKQQC